MHRPATTRGPALACTLLSYCSLIALACAAPVAHAQSADAPTPSIPGLVVAPPSTPAGREVSPPPGLFVAPPARPGPQAEPQKPEPKKSAQPRRRTSSSQSADATPVARGSTKIVALVNDEPITGFAVEERARFLALSGNIGDRARDRMKAIAQDPKTNERLKAILQETIAANKGKTRDQIIAAFEVRKKAYVTGLQKQAIDEARAGIIPTMRRKALDELIEERLKLQEAKKLTINVADADVDRMFADMAQRNKMTPAQFAEHVSRQGADASVIKSRVKASLAWREVVRKRYGHQISVSQRDVEALAMKAGGEETQELKIALITIATPGKVDQSSMAARLAEAHSLRAAFRGCSSMPGLAKGRANARYQDLGFKTTSTIAEPTRSLLLSARDNEMLPPNLSAGGVELYAVCGRRNLKLDEEKRQAAETQLTMQEFEKLAQRYLHDLRKDALIEMR